MNYFVIRDDQRYGPYTLADLQKYVSSGEILLTDLAQSEGMSEPLPVSQIIGTISVSQLPVSGAPISIAHAYPDPPNLHWALVLLFGIISCGLFTAAWDIVQAVWMRQVAPQSKALYYYLVYAADLVLIAVFSFIAAQHHVKNPLVSFLQLAAYILTLIGRFSLRSSLEKHFNDVEPMGLLLSGVMTFFFGAIYFQYHFNDINRRKNLDRVGFQPA
jgi:hypothetical protein